MNSLPGSKVVINYLKTNLIKEDPRPQSITWCMQTVLTVTEVVGEIGISIGTCVTFWPKKWTITVNWWRISTPKRTTTSRSNVRHANFFYLNGVVYFECSSQGQSQPWVLQKYFKAVIWKNLQKETRVVERQLMVCQFASIVRLLALTPFTPS